jgi:hypothetical protein
MRTLLAVAAAAVLSLAAVPAFADDANQTDDTGFVAGVFTAPAVPDTTFDLGVDVTGIPHTPGAVKAYLGSLAPETREVLQSSCQHYMQTPDSARDTATIGFCSVVVGG